MYVVTLKWPSLLVMMIDRMVGIPQMKQLIRLEVLHDYELFSAPALLITDGPSYALSFFIPSIIHHNTFLILHIPLGQRP